MVWYYLRFLFFPTILMYARRVKIRNAHRIRTDQPVLISMNHPNAFLDAIAFSAYFFYPRTYFMARGDAFKKGFVSSVLESTGIVPIFRMRDAGLEGVKKNADSFQVVYKLWNKKKKVIVFSEGLCIQERRLRPIQKGTARMAFGFLEQYKAEKFLIVPVSVTYSKPSAFGTEIFYDVGNPIQAAEYLNLFKENQAKAVNTLTKNLEEEMKAVTPHLNEKSYDELIEQLQDLDKKDWLKKNSLDPSKQENSQKYWWHITQLLNQANEQEKEKLEDLKNKVKQYSEKLIKLELSDSTIDTYSQNQNFNLANKTAVLSMGMPFYLVGKYWNFLPFYLSAKLSKKLAKTIEFYASFNFVIGSFILKFLLIFELFLVGIFAKSFLILLAYPILKFTFGMFSNRFGFYLNQVLNLWKINKLNTNNKPIVDSLIQERKEIRRILDSLENSK